MTDARQAVEVPGITSDAFTRLGWAARRYAFVVVPLLVNVVTIAFLVTADDRRTQTFTAKAIVVASDLELHPTQLPRLAKSVFAGPTVAARVHTQLRLDRDTPSLIPERITMEPVADTVVLEVQGRAGDAASAVVMANTAADVFAEELVRAGAGSFQVQVPAEQPLVAVAERLSMTALLLNTTVAGLLLVLAILALLVRVRRPLLTPGDVVAEVGVPVLGTIVLPSRADDPEAVLGRDRGVEVLARRLSARGSTTLVLRGDPDTLSARRALSGVLATPSDNRPAIECNAEEDLVGADPRAAWVLAVAQDSSADETAQRLHDLPASLVLGALFLRRRARRSASPVVDGAVAVDPVGERGEQR